MVKLIEITGKALSGEWGLEDENRTGIPVLRTTNFTNLGIINYGDVVTRNITKKNISEKFLRKGDIIIEKSGGSDKQPVGRVVLFNGEENRFLFNNFTGVLRVKDREKWVQDYVFYALFANYRNGGTRKYENKTTGLHNLKTDLYINNYEIEWINIAEQKNVCATLRKIESIISDMNKEIDYLDELIKARFVEMFDGEQCAILQDLSDRITDGSHLPPKGVEKSDYLMLSSQNVFDEINRDGARFLLKEDFENENRRTDIKDGDVLVTIVGTIGRTHIVRSGEKYVFQRSVGVIKPKSDRLNSVYLASYLQTCRAKAFLTSRAHGSSQKGIYLQDLKKLPVPLVPMALQNEFATFVAQVDKSKFAVQKSLKKTQLLFDSLMQEYFG